MVSVSKDRLTFGPLATAAMGLVAGGAIALTEDSEGPLLAFVAPIDVNGQFTVKDDRAAGGTWCSRCGDLLTLEVGAYEVEVGDMYFDGEMDRYPITMPENE